jgi:hypothetical protein
MEVLLGASTPSVDPPQSSLETSSDVHSKPGNVRSGAWLVRSGVRTSRRRCARELDRPSRDAEDVEALLGASRQPEAERPGQRGRQDESRVEEVLPGAPPRSNARPNGTEARRSGSSIAVVSSRL